MTGNGEAGAMVNGPGPGRLKLTTLRSLLTLALAIAWRSEPSPVSLVLVTVRHPFVLLMMLPPALLALMFVFWGCSIERSATQCSPECNLDRQRR